MNIGEFNLLLDEFIENLFKETSNSSQYKKERHLFGTAITPIGHIDYTDSILSQVKKNILFRRRDRYWKNYILNKGI